MKTTITGSKAEVVVASYLKNLGFKIVERNWKTPTAEIDIVAIKDNRVYFIEVKYRSSLEAGDGFDYITDKKLKHMQRAAESWVQEKNWQNEIILMAASVIGGNHDIDLREIA
jgi:putative endonuclease